MPREVAAGEVTGRGGRDLSDKDLSAAVVDISRLVTASARLKKLDAPESETGPRSLDSLEKHIYGLMYPNEGGAASAAVPGSAADPRGGRRS